ncbi:hypothetical protein LTR17_026295 [Elasticomyces elasticus]|nr:hypothetical protein LTR17_026295 [Elasticomyces elasticus]
MGVQDAPGEPTYRIYNDQISSHQQPHQYAPQQTYPNAYSQGPSKKRKAATADAPVVDLTQESPPKKRRSRQAKHVDDSGLVDDVKPKKAARKSKKIDEDDDAAEKPKKKARKPKDEEKRLRRWRKHAPSSYLEVRDRALTQRMFCLDRQRDSTDSAHPTETISLAGSTGNVYTIVIDKVPSCDCPHARKGNQCKHIAYVLSRVLRAPAQLEYQLALTSSELREIFTKAPPLPSETADASEEKDGNRKAIEGECPICCVDFEPESGEAIVYCKAACGNNIHADCFKQWAATKTNGSVPCPFCRTPWQAENGGEAAAKNIAREGPKSAEGYANVASQLGLSGRRDYSSYHSHWVRRQAMNGNIGWDEDGVMMHDY